MFLLTMVMELPLSTIKVQGILLKFTLQRSCGDNDMDDFGAKINSLFESLSSATMHCAIPAPLADLSRHIWQKCFTLLQLLQPLPFVSVHRFSR